jgi:hypothetical protein
MPDTVVVAGTAGLIDTNLTCAETEAMAMSGSFSGAECTLLRFTGISLLCGCAAASTTKAPVAAPTKAPVATPVAIPTKVPAASPTKAPVAVTKAPSAAPVAPTASPIKATPPPVTEAPVAAPTTAPVATTGAPTTAPVATTTAPVATTGAPTTEAPAAMNVTEAPSAMNATAPTAVPANGTAAPTLSPVAGGPTFLNGTVGIRLSYTTGPLTESTQPAYDASCTQFFKANLNGTIANIKCSLVSQSPETSRRLRSLQTNETLDTVTSVSGIALTNDVNASDFNSLLASTVDDNSDELVALLKESGGNTAGQEYFSSLVSVESFDPEVSMPVASPAPAPTTGKGGDSGLSGGAIFGIVAAVAVGVGVLIGGVYYSSKSEHTSPRALTYTDPMGGDAAVTSSVKEVTDSDNGAGIPAAAAFNASFSSLKQNMISRTVFAPPGKLGIVIDTTPEGPVVRTINPESRLKGTLFPGDLIVAVDDVDTSTMSASAITALMARTADARRKLTVLSEDVTNSRAVILVPGAAASAASVDSSSCLKQNMISRTVLAPPGKLGIVIDTTVEGPVVQAVNSQSPLEGSLFPGDIIVAVDDVDTRAMSASAITALMVRTANLPRKLTVLSEDVTN